MSEYMGDEDYWRQYYLDRCNFESPVSEQPNQQFELQTSHEQQIESYFSCTHESYLKYSQSGAMLSQSDFTKESFAEITDSELHDAPEDHDEGYQRWEDDFEGVETDLTRQKRKIELVSPCESYSSLSEHEEEPGTTDPYLSHKIYMPYNRILKPRYFASAGTDVEYRASSLLRRPRSPVREILPGRFDLKAAYEERSMRRWATESSKRLRESKERVSLSLKRLSVDQTDEDDVISSVVLQAVCEEVTLTLMDTKIDTDIHTFVNVAVIWALSELELFTHDTLIERFTATKDFRAHGAKKELDVVDVLGYGGMRKKLAGVYRPPYSHNVHTTLHLRLPWEYVSPSHERGQTKLYPNVRERIDEKVPKINEEDESSTYVPDITCFHLREVLDKTYVAYKRKSKSLVPLTESSLNLMEDLFLQLVSFL
ncbi:uncharacterized protein LOC128872969 isoform X2 [Hylaeus volcanicus]|uniref:uncharacterized protein LOC128872969 isoform X2 n=1 Tax=Hylaeus volcanicus TaxID=313075 RepID=UPI0023B78A3D|nr:uncharacterized protein LOC128872969 isoform X2 [Hylaeus volcanicus]